MRIDESIGNKIVIEFDERDTMEVRRMVTNHIHMIFELVRILSSKD